MYGHNCGDVVLQNVASIMKTRCSRCINCRWGGEEFIIFAGADVLTNALLEDFRKTIEDTTIISDGTAVKVTITIGVSDYSSGHTIDEWVSSSDARLYEGKQTGKNKVVA